MSLLDARQTSPGAARRGGARQAAPVGKLRDVQVIDLIDGIIAERGLGPGDLLPTQKDLAELAGVSLITVRRALDELERSGRVSGHQGVGTFVARPRIVSEPTRSGGLLATLHRHRYAIGSLRFLQAKQVDLTPSQPTIDRLQSTGHTLIALADLGPADAPAATSILIAVFALKDELRPDAPATLEMLHKSGISIVVLSGDHEAAVLSALTNMPVDQWFFEVKPEQKAQKIAEIREKWGQNGEPAHANQQKNGKKTKIAFVGDGVNDAPALATADLGIALASGADLAKAAGDVILVSEHLIRVPQTLALARVTFRVIKQNLVWAFAYNLLALPLAMLGMLPPAAAAGAMVLSSLSVVGNALRLYRVKL